MRELGGDLLSRSTHFYSTGLLFGTIGSVRRLIRLLECRAESHARAGELKILKPHRTISTIARSFACLKLTVKLTLYLCNNVIQGLILTLLLFCFIFCTLVDIFVNLIFLNEYMDIDGLYCIVYLDLIL